MMQQCNNIIKTFDKIVKNHPDKTALISGAGSKISYKALDLYSNQIAHYILSKISPSNKRIGIAIARSFETIATTIACLKLGYTYVTLAPDYPRDRMNDICNKAELELVVCNSEVQEKISNAIRTIDIDTEKPLIQSNMSIESMGSQKPYNDIASIVFTSGTTDSPKGVKVKNLSILNLVQEQNYVSINHDDVFLQLSPYEFDGSTFEIWGALLNGATLVLMPPGYPILSVLADRIASYNVSILFITTQLFNLMVDNRLEILGSIKQILFGGEKASSKHVKKFISDRKNNTYLANIYGPTECTTFSTFYPIKDKNDIIENTIPIGKPICNVDYQISSDNELLIGGAGLMEGYLNNPELTKKNFFYDEQQHINYYKTGDLVKINHNNDIVFIGRLDKQLKIRGYRFLPGEIEKTAMHYQNVSSAALTTTEVANDNYMTLFIETNTNTFNLNKFKQYMKDELPGYMQVNLINTIDKMPLKKSGKINYKILNETIPTKRE